MKTKDWISVFGALLLFCVAVGIVKASADKPVHAKPENVELVEIFTSAKVVSDMAVVGADTNEVAAAAQTKANTWLRRCQPRCQIVDRKFAVSVAGGPAVAMTEWSGRKDVSQFIITASVAIFYRE